MLPQARFCPSGCRILLAALRGWSHPRLSGEPEYGLGSQVLTARRRREEHGSLRPQPTSLESHRTSMLIYDSTAESTLQRRCRCSAGTLGRPTCLEPTAPPRGCAVRHEQTTVDRTRTIERTCSMRRRLWQLNCRMIGPRECTMLGREYGFGPLELDLRCWLDLRCALREL